MSTKTVNGLSSGDFDSEYYPAVGSWEWRRWMHYKAHIHGDIRAIDSLGLDKHHCSEYLRILAGPGSKWYLSARLLLGLSESEAEELRHVLKRARWLMWRVE